MKINNKTNFNYFPNKYNSSNNKFERSPLRDTLCFKSKTQINHDNQYNNVSENNNTALEFAQKLSEEKSFSLEKLEELIYNYDRLETIVKPMDELNSHITGLNPNDYRCFFMSKMRGDYTPYNKRMFLKFPDNNDDKSKLFFVMDASHEFTHLLQSKSNKEFKTLKDLSDGDIDKARVISSASTKIFSEFENIMKNDAIKFVFDDPNADEMFEYNKIIPKPKLVSQGDILKSLNLKNIGEFNEKCKDIFNKEFDKAVENSFYEDSYLAQRYSDEDSLNNIREKIKKYVQLQASKEKEAYLTECLVAKKALNNENGLNIDSIPMFYGMLETALD